MSVFYHILRCLASLSEFGEKGCLLPQFHSVFWAMPLVGIYPSKATCSQVYKKIPAHEEAKTYSENKEGLPRMVNGRLKNVSLAEFEPNFRDLILNFSGSATQALNFFFKAKKVLGSQKIYQPCRLVKSLLPFDTPTTRSLMSFDLLPIPEFQKAMMGNLVDKLHWLVDQYRFECLLGSLHCVLVQDTTLYSPYPGV